MSENHDAPGQSDWLRPGAKQSGEETREQVSESTAVQGDEGGGDPAAGAEGDATGEGVAQAPSGPDGGHRSGREGG